MPKIQNIDLIRYEYVVHINSLGAYDISEILLTKDDFVDLKSVSDQIKWTPVENINVDIVDTTEETGKSSEDSISKAVKNRICGIFDAAPLDWKYARILIDNKASTKHSFVIAKMPRSPIVPVVFEVSE